MAGKIQLWCVSHTVKGTCTFRVSDGGGNDITIAEGVYWTDPVYTTSTIPTVCALAQTTIMLDSELGGTRTKAYTATSTPFASFYTAGIDNTTVTFAGTHANNTAEGRRWLMRIGAGNFVDIGSDEMGVMQGIWTPVQGEYGDQQEHPESLASVVRSYAGTAYSFRIGDPITSRLIKFSGLAERLVWANGYSNAQGLQTSLSDYSFETHVWNYLQRGEKVRIYDDKTATRTWLNAAMTTTSQTATVASGSGISDNTVIWIDGEKVYVVSGGGTSTLTLARDNPIAHSVYAPVSTDRVATYVLHSDDMGEYMPARRAHNQARYDLDVRLLKTTY